MKAYGNNAQAAGLAQRAFGTQVDQLLPLFEKGAAGVRELMAEADDLGLTISREDAEAAAAFTDQLNRMARVFKVGIFAAGAAVAPMIAEFAQKMMDAAKIATQWVKEHQDVLKTALKIGGGLAAAGASLIAVGGALSGLGVTLGAVGTAFAFLISPVGLVTAGLGAAALA
ncbi:MAG: hypothetical protein GWN87_01340, partial [Desulfuromonadales bacterium]|nr:hypothetical protein [Desulfuromonadales bacterium]